MQLTIDIGNTRVKIVLFENGIIVERFYQKKLTLDWLKKLWINRSIEAVILSSVAKEMVEIESWLKQHTHFIQLSYTTAIPIKNGYKTPKTLGNDRIAAAVGAFSLFPNKNCLIVDAGTCITYEFIDASGTYRGGSIAPGIDMRFKAMHQFTAKLPLIAKQRLTDFIGFNTETSMRTGGQLAATLELEGFLARYEATFGAIELILTGGDAEIISQQLLHKKHIIHKDLVLIGLHKILAYNANILE